MYKDYSFIQIGRAVVPKGKKEIVFIIEVLGETVITTNGCYTKEQLSSVIEVAKLEMFINNKN